MDNFRTYCNMVLKEMLVLGYNVSEESIHKLEDYIGFVVNSNCDTKIFIGWHNTRYMKQCVYNLQEKYDCGGIDEEDWERLVENTGYCEK